MEPSVFIEEYPKTIIDIYIQVLCADGGTRCASVTAASLALADAGISLRDLVCGVAVGKISKPDPPTLVLDLSDIEDKEGLGDLPIACMPRTRAYTLLQFDGQMTPDEFRNALDLAEKGIEKINQIQIQTIKQKYAQIDQENNSEKIDEEGA